MESSDSPHSSYSDSEDDSEDDWGNDYQDDSELPEKPNFNHHHHGYRRLNPEIGEIRLLRLDLSRSDDAVLSCRLTHRSLTSGSKFVALSYVWGDPDDTAQIRLDECIVSVTRNLHQALARLRRDGFKRRIWVDALCIDQDSVDEKNTQVPLMGKIFNLATKVVVWLGNELDDGALVALCELDRLQKIFPREGDESVISQRVRFDRMVVENSLAKSGIEGAPPAAQPEFAVDFRAIRRLVHRPWFRRVWVIQEILLARKSQICCGPEADDPRVSGYAMLGGLGVISEMEKRVVYENGLRPFVREIAWRTSPFHGMTRYNALRIKNNGARAPTEPPKLQIPLLYALYRIQDSREGDDFHAGTISGGIVSTDPRDLVYGILGIVEGVDSALIKIDYAPDTTMARVFFVAGRACLHRYGPEMFLFCQGQRLLSQGLPSWAPDWASKLGSLLPESSNIFYRQDRKKYTNASGAIGWTANPTVMQVSWEDPCVSLRGRVLNARVAQVGRTIRGSGLGLGIPRWRKHTAKFREMVGEVNSNQPDPNIAQANRANAWRALLGGPVWGHWYDTPVDFSRHFDILSGKVTPPSDLTLGEREWVNLRTLEYRERLRITGNRLFVDEAGRPGLAPPRIAPSDAIAVFAGATYPTVLRETEMPGRYRVIGAAYLYGVMDGEAFEGVNTADDLDEICLV
ncbi:hypothetical protein OQA88_914 [Cercophora sp. LCS_1]